MNQTLGITLLVGATIFSVAAQLALKKVAVDSPPALDRLPEALIALGGNLFLWVFGVSAVASTALWILVLKYMNVNVAFPISNGLGFVILGILAFFLFGERLNLVQLGGMAVILAGIAITSLGS